MLSDDVVDRVLARFGIAAPTPTRAGAEALFAAWCAAVPFDNVLKRLALARGEPLPGRDAASFFRDFLDTGAGGTCWATSGALFALYQALGFRARRAAAAMRSRLDGPPRAANHGTVLVDVDGDTLFADASILAGELVPLVEGASTTSSLIPLRVERAGANLAVRFRSGHGDEPSWCEILDVDVDGDFFEESHDASRTHSPFNDALMARRNRPGCVVVLHGTTRTVRGETGLSHAPLVDVAAALVDDIGIAPGLAAAAAGLS